MAIPGPPISARPQTGSSHASAGIARKRHRGIAGPPIRVGGNPAGSSHISAGIARKRKSRFRKFQMGSGRYRWDPIGKGVDVRGSNAMHGGVWVPLTSAATLAAAKRAAGRYEKSKGSTIMAKKKSSKKKSSKKKSSKKASKKSGKRRSSKKGSSSGTPAAPKKRRARRRRKGQKGPNRISHKDPDGLGKGAVKCPAGKTAVATIAKHRRSGSYVFFGRCV